MTNMDKNGVRYGTIYLNHLNSDVAHELWINGDDLSYRNAIEELTDAVRQTLLDEEWPEDELEDELEYRVERQSERIEIDEPTIAGEYEGVKYEISWLGGAPLLWCLESPHIAKHGLCSPCCPNAADLESEGDYEGYTVPQDWLAED